MVKQAALTAQQAAKQEAATAYAKAARGEKLNASERAAIRRYDRAREEELRWAFYEEIPQKHWREMSGRAAKVLREQAERYGIPFGSATISLPKVVRALHDFLAKNAHKIAADDEAMRGSGNAVIDEYRAERVLLLKMERQERERSLLPRDEVRTHMGRIAAIVRAGCETLGRQFGDEAVDIIVEAIEDAEAETERIFGRQVES